MLCPYFVLRSKIRTQQCCVPTQYLYSVGIQHCCILAVSLLCPARFYIAGHSIKRSKRVQVIWVPMNHQVTP